MLTRATARPHGCGRDSDQRSLLRGYAAGPRRYAAGPRRNAAGPRRYAAGLGSPAAYGTVLVRSVLGLARVEPRPDELHHR
ncbi:MAG: hypothetical protein ABI083_05965, partial [Lapillicoccus sp.]